MSYSENVSIKDVIISIGEYLRALVNPPYRDKSLNRLRQTAIIESGTVTTVSTVTTVTTVTGLTNIDSYQGRIVVLGQNLSAWAVCCRNRIS